MGRVVKAPVNLETLRLARTAAGYKTAESVVQVVDFLKKSPDGIVLLESIESGQQSLSLPRAKELAKRYGIPFTHLYLEPEQFWDVVPDVFKITDFRKEEDKHLTPNMIRFLREVFFRQNWLRELAERKKKFRRSESGFKHIPPSQVADEYRSILWPGGSAPAKSLFEWINQIEANMGVYVMQSRPSHYSYKVESQFSGAAFQDENVPVIALNGADNQERRLFTLIHELAHITHAGSGISKVEYRLGDGHIDDIEAWCNQVAAETLMPKEVFINYWNQSRITKNALESSKSASSKLGVSISAAAVRASKLDLIEYKDAAYVLRTIQQTQEKSVTKTPQHRGDVKDMAQKLKARDRAGPAMTKLALQSYDEGSISARDLYDIFGVKLHHLPKIAEQVDHQLIRWHGEGA